MWYALLDAAAPYPVHFTAVVGDGLDHPTNPTPARRVYDLLDPRNFDGIILFTGSLAEFTPDESLRAFLETLKPLPVVSLGVPLEGVPSVSVDQGAAMAELVRHLHDAHGYRKFGFVEGPADQLEARERKQAVEETLRQLGVPASALTLYPGNYSRDHGALAFRQFARATSGPVALVCCNDDQAIGALGEARTLGIAVPGRIAVTGFDDLSLSTLQEPSLTTANQPIVQLAVRAFDLLWSQLEGTKTSSSRWPSEVKYRESCGCRPLASPEAPSTKADLITRMLGPLTNTSRGFQEFASEWLSDYLTAFEYLLDTGNSSVLRSLWSRYYAFEGLDQERGLSFRRLFAGLQSLYRDQPRFHESYEENLMLAGGGEASRAIRQQEETRNFFISLHAVETAIGRVTTRDGLAGLGDAGWAAVGVTGVAVVRFGAPPTIVYRWNSGVVPPAAALTVDYPELLPPGTFVEGERAPRVVVALTVENHYLGYAVFWTRRTDSFATDLLATQFAALLQRIELMERLAQQSGELTKNLDDTRRMQEQLVETEKVASLGRLVAGVAHEINTPLGTGITGTSYLLERLGEVKRQFGEGNLARSGLDLFFTQGIEATEGVLRNLMKAGELIQAFKGLGLDQGQGDWRPVEVEALFLDLLKVYGSEFSKRGIALDHELPEAGLHVVSLPSVLVQVTSELLENALEHAFPRSWEGEARVLVQVSVADDQLHIAVTDNGRGLSAEERRHLFDPLFTTRRPEGHAGLGLHLAFQLIHRTLGGRMTVASEPGEGTCFLCQAPVRPS